MDLVVVGEPGRKPAQDGLGVGNVADADVVAPEGADEGLGHAIALRALDRRGPGLETDAVGEAPHVAGVVAAAVVAEPLDGVGQSVDQAESVLDGGDHQILDVFAGDAAGGGHEAHGLPVAAVEGKGDADALAVAAADLEAVGTPAPVPLGHGDAAIVAPLLASGMALARASRHHSGRDPRRRASPMQAHYGIYAVSALPRTNNGLEQLFGSQRYHERRATGRKMASPATVLRGEVVWFVPAYLQMSCTSQFIRNRRRF